MTDKEALRDFKKFISIKTTMPPAFTGKVIDALEKQIPMKPVYFPPEEEENGMWNVYGDCPACNEDLSIDVKHDYCPSCGQKLDWSDFIEHID